jgi:hypothetical protein
MTKDRITAEEETAAATSEVTMEVEETSKLSQIICESADMA